MQELEEVLKEILDKHYVSVTVGYDYGGDNDSELIAYSEYLDTYEPEYDSVLDGCRGVRKPDPQLRTITFVPLEYNRPNTLLEAAKLALKHLDENLSENE